jgi:hypothetical protein
VALSRFMGERCNQLRKPFGMLGTNDSNTVGDAIRTDAHGATVNEAEHFARLLRQNEQSGPDIRLLKVYELGLAWGSTEILSRHAVL